MLDHDFLPVHGGAAAPTLHTDNVCRVHLPDTGGLGGAPGSDPRGPGVVVVTRAGVCRRRRSFLPGITVTSRWDSSWPTRTQPSRFLHQLFCVICSRMLCRVSVVFRLNERPINAKVSFVTRLRGIRKKARQGTQRPRGGGGLYTDHSGRARGERGTRGEREDRAPARAGRRRRKRVGDFEGRGVRGGCLWVGSGERSRSA